MASAGIVPRRQPRSRSKDARAVAGRCKVRRSFGSLADHAIQVDEENQVAVGAHGGAGKKYTRRRYSPRFLITISSLRWTILDDQADLTDANMGRPCE